MWISGLTSDPNEVIRRKPKAPQGYEDTEAFLREMRENYSRGKDSNQHNQDAGEEDAAFVVGKQWEDLVEQRRRVQRKPTLVFNRMMAFVGQIVGNRLMNETEIRVWPDKGGTKAAAQLREGLIRSIYKNTSADFARDEAMKYQVIGGQGVFCLRVVYASDDVFEQKIEIGTVANPYSATFDPLSVEPSGGDAEWVTVEDDIPEALYEKRWPWASLDSFTSGSWNSEGYWKKEGTIRIVSYWKMVVEGFRTLALFLDGTTHDVTDKEEFEYLHLVDTRPDGTPYTRDVPNRFARMYVCSGKEILEGPFDYPVSSIPVYRVPGWEVTWGEKTARWGLVRFLKDPQRLDNYWASTQAEQMIAAPRNKFLTTPEAVRGHEQRWRRSPSSDDPFLFYNEGEIPPSRLDNPPPDVALYTERAKLQQDMKDISNIHEASFGAPSNEVSGKAIQQRTMNADLGSYIYHDRLRIADERCARNINELIPYLYDTHRMVTIMGSDGKEVLEYINNPENPDSDMTIGKYGITVSVGPSSVTKRALAAEQMMAFVNAIPDVADKVMDLVAEAQDWPKADEFAKRFRKMMIPSGLIPESEMTDEEKEQISQGAEMQQLQQQLEMRDAELELKNKEAQANLRVAQAAQAEAAAYKYKMDAESRRLDVDSKNDERDDRSALGAIEQHNKLEEIDREFSLKREQMDHQNFDKDRTYFSGRQDRQEDREDNKNSTEGKSPAETKPRVSKRAKTENKA